MPGLEGGFLMFGDWQPYYDLDFDMTFRCSICFSYTPEGFVCPWCAFLGTEWRVSDVS